MSRSSVLLEYSQFIIFVLDLCLVNNGSYCKAENSHSAPIDHYVDNYISSFMSKHNFIWQMIPQIAIVQNSLKMW